MEIYIDGKVEELSFQHLEIFFFFEETWHTFTHPFILDDLSVAVGFIYTHLTHNDRKTPTSQRPPLDFSIRKGFYATQFFYSYIYIQLTSF